jgi:hypothetical protein
MDVFHNQSKHVGMDQFVIVNESELLLLDGNTFQATRIDEKSTTGWRPSENIQFAYCLYDVSTDIHCK